MVVKRTKSGFSFAMDWHLRMLVQTSIIEAIHEKIFTPRLHDERGIADALHHAVLSTILQRKNFQLNTTAECRMAFSIAEAVALMWHLRNHDHNTFLLELKSAIHKQLHA